MSLVIFLVASLALAFPVYVIGQRSGVRNAWVAYIPIGGAAVVLLWSIRSPGWWVIAGLVPVLNIFFLLWLFFALPRTHRRSGLWGLALLVPLVGM